MEGPAAAAAGFVGLTVKPHLMSEIDSEQFRLCRIDRQSFPRNSEFRSPAVFTDLRSGGKIEIDETVAVLSVPQIAGCVDDELPESIQVFRVREEQLDTFHPPYFRMVFRQTFLPGLNFNGNPHADVQVVRIISERNRCGIRRNLIRSRQMPVSLPFGLTPNRFLQPTVNRDSPVRNPYSSGSPDHRSVNRSGCLHQQSRTETESGDCFFPHYAVPPSQSKFSNS